MKVLILITLLALSPLAQSEVLCRSAKDWNFIDRFPGYTCPRGWMFVRIVT